MSADIFLRREAEVKRSKTKPDIFGHFEKLDFVLVRTFKLSSQITCTKRIFSAARVLCKCKGKFKHTTNV